MKSKLLLAALCLLVFGGVAAAADFLTFEPKAGPGGGKHVVLLSGDEEYRSEEGLPMLAKILSQRQGFRCTVLFAVAPEGVIDPQKGDSLSHPEALDTADAIVMLLRFRHWPDATMARFDAAMKRGVPLVGLRTSTHAFAGLNGAYANYNNFGKQVMGESWVNHWGGHKHEATRGVIEPSAKDNPLLRGVSDVFGDTNVYEAYPVSDATILLRGQVLKGMQPTDPPADYKKNRSSDHREQGVNDPMMPIAWSRENHPAAGVVNKVLCTTMGSSTDLQNEGLRRLIVNGVFWGLGLDVPAKADVEYLDPFKPTMYGFGGYRKHTTPAEHELGKPYPPEEKPEGK